MPSGAKKRKAAKKKKENEANNSSTANSKGNGDLKIQDEKESDNGDVSFPVSQDHHHHSFVEGSNGEKEEEKDTPSVQPLVAGEKTKEPIPNDEKDMQEVGLVADSELPIVNETKPEDDSEHTDLYIEQAKPSVESRDGCSSSSSSNESQVREDSVFDGSPKTRAEAYNSVLGASPADIPAKLPVSLPDVVTRGTEGPLVEENYNSVMANSPVVVDEGKPVIATQNDTVEKTLSSDSVELGLKENGKKILPPSEEKDSRLSPVIVDMDPRREEDKKSATLNENLRTASDTKVSGSKENGEKMLPSSMFNSSEAELNSKDDKVLSLVGETSGQYSSTNLDTLKEKGEKMPPCSEETSSMVSESMEREEKVFPLLDENSVASSGAMGLKVEGGKMVQSSDSRSVRTNNSVENVRGSEIPEPTNSLTLVPLPPQRLQKTSWKGCCGLFDLFSGTGH